MSRPALVDRRVFVIMPFVHGGTRNETQLNAFFENNIKRAIEGADLKYRYRVYRSGQSFDITSEIIRDLCRADIVIADLSGTEPNPNVMYELGVRLAISESPVILIRENLPSNKRIFDIFGFYAHPYDPLDYRPLEQHLVDKLRRWEAREESYTNPVLGLIRTELALINPDLTDVSPDKQRELVLHGVRAVSANIERAFGPNGVGVALESAEGPVVEKRGSGIVGGIKSGNAFEEAGIRLMASAAQQMSNKLGDGTKLPILIAHTLIEGSVAATQRGFPQKKCVDRDSSLAASKHKTRYATPQQPENAPNGRRILTTCRLFRLSLDALSRGIAGRPRSRRQFEGAHPLRRRPARSLAGAAARRTRRRLEAPSRKSAD